MHFNSRRASSFFSTSSSSSLLLLCLLLLLLLSLLLLSLLFLLLLSLLLLWLSPTQELLWDMLGTVEEVSQWLSHQPQSWLVNETVEMEGLTAVLI